MDVFMRKKIYFILYLAASGISAQNLPNHLRDFGVDVAESKIHAPEDNIEYSNKEEISLSAEEAIEYALIQKDYEFLEQYLPMYRQQANADVILADFAQAAMLRQQFYPHSALPFYEKILALRPDYDFVRLAYAQALFEDRQYDLARTEILKINQSLLSENSRILLDKYLQEIDKFYRNQYRFEASIEKNDNINHAGKHENIVVQGLVLSKNPKSLPQSDTGMQLSADIHRLFPIYGAHHFQLGANLNALAYADSKDYNEYKSRIFAGYRYQTLRHQWDVKPYIGKNWLGSDDYNKELGMNVEYKYRFHPNWQARFGAGISHEKYDELSHLNANKYHANAMLLNQQSNYYLYGGIAANRRRTQSEQERETQASLFTGGQYVFENSFGIRADWQVVSRKFDQANTFYPNAREDIEHRARLGVFSPHFSWQGITPILNYQYVNTDSNLSELYDKTNSRVYFSIFKDF